MKMKLHLFNIAVILALGSICACNQEPLPSFKENGQVLMLSPSLVELQDGNIRTRAISDAELSGDQYNESKVSRLDVFIFKADGTSAKIYHLPDISSASVVHHGNMDGYLLSSDWRNDGLSKGVNYKVYVVANSTNENITGATTITETDLKAEATVDGDIYKLYKEGVSDKTYSSDKTFLMNATVASWSINDDTIQFIGGDTVILERAAVKFVMDVYLGDRLISKLAEDEREYGKPNWKFLNFNSATPEIPEGTAPDEQLISSQSGAEYYLDVVEGQTGHYIVTTYAYPQTWTGKSSTVTIDGNTLTVNNVAPALLVSYPAYDKDAQTPHFHYYYIPLCDYKTISSTQRNKVYKVNAEISSYGSFETLSNDPVTLTYEVKPWVEAEAEVNAYATDYILATPSRYSFKGGAENESLREIIKYYASGNVTISDIKAYYINKAGTQVDVTGSGYTIGTPANGQIEITSTVPTNGTYRTVEFTVNCGDKSQVVIFRHYPADFVAGIAGLWSSYSFNGWAENGVSGKSYNTSYVYSGTFYFDSSGDGIFESHVYYNGQVYVLNTSGNRGSSVSDATNNRMYVLQITAANDNYCIGYPQLTEHTAHVYEEGYYSDTDLGTVKYYTSTDNVLSPAFMLGSQLGVNSGFPTQATSAIHCALYKEVANDGTVFTGWRLPTKQEVQYMIDNQNNDVMIEVLGGRYYWTLDGGKAEYSGGSYPNQTFTRCVRDVTPEDIAKLNQF